MKKYDHIRPVTDNTAAEPAPIPPGGYTGVEPLPEDAEIDRILKLTADELTAEVDFAGIRERALKSAKAAKAKRGKLRRAVSYGLFAAASVFFGFALFTVLGKIHTAPHGSVDVRYDVAHELEINAGNVSVVLNIGIASQDGKTYTVGYYTVTDSSIPIVLEKNGKNITADFKKQ